jgi:hypothetical protein
LASAKQLVQHRLVINPEFEVIRLDYPVHIYQVDQAAERIGDYFALVFRVPDTGIVYFMDLSGLHTYILTRLVEESIPLGRLKGDIAQVSGIECGKYLDDALDHFVKDLMNRKLILGFLKG